MVRPCRHATVVRPKSAAIERNLSSDVVLGQPSDLSLADHVHRLDTLNRSRRRIEGAKPLTGSHPPFDRPLIPLHDVVELAARAAPATQRFVSSTRHERFVIRSSRRQRRFNSRE